MDRLTGIDHLGWYAPIGAAYEERQRGPIIDRLAAYEDTGLEPSKVTEFYLRFCAARDIAMALGQYYADRAEKLMDADKEGRLIVLPCKVGDTVYEPTNRGTISTYLVRGFQVGPFGSIWLQWDIQTGFVYRNIDGVNIDKIGKTVFLTCEEAEAALGRSKSNGN